MLKICTCIYFRVVILSFFRFSNALRSDEVYRHILELCSFKKKINLFIYLFLAALGLRRCTRAFSSCCKQGLLFVVVRGLLVVVAFLVEHRLWVRGLQ